MKIDNKNLIFITTHVMNNAVISEYKKLLNIPEFDCCLLIDNTNLKYEFDSRLTEREFFGTKVNCLFFDEKLNNELNLPAYSEYNNKTFGKVMWYNADYRFYYAKKYFPNYEYYWQMEFDVFCNGPSYEPFLSKYSNLNQDLLICDFRKEKLNATWYWSKKVDWAYSGNDIYGAIFPICRMRNTAIDFLYKKRLERGKQYEKIEDKKNCAWLFCELFTCTELMNAGFSCGAIQEEHVTWDKEYDLNDRLYETPDNQVYHPVKGCFLERIKNLQTENKNFKNKIKKLEDDLNKEKANISEFNLFGHKILIKKK